MIGPFRVSVNIQQGSDISVAVHAMIGMTHPIGPQDADIKAIFFCYDFVIPYGKVNLKIKAGDGIVTSVDKSSTHGLFLSCDVFVIFIVLPIRTLFHPPDHTESICIKQKAGAAFLQPLPVHF